MDWTAKTRRRKPAPLSEQVSREEVRASLLQVAWEIHRYRHRDIGILRLLWRVAMMSLVGPSE